MKINFNINYYLVPMLLSLMMLPSKAISQDSLQAYIQIGLKNNLTVQQKNLNIEQASLALSSAKGLFLPTINFNGLVSHADGGRYADLPLGDMLNPVYSTLNQMTSSNSFPSISNQSINFLPQKYYDVYFRTSMPLYNGQLKQNKLINASQISIKQLELEAYKRDLVKEIKNAYYDYQSANAAMVIYSQAIQLLEKNVQVNQSLYNNGKGLQANVLRSKAELEKVNAMYKAAELNVVNAKSYFNFLLNRPLNVFVDVLTEQQLMAVSELSSDTSLIKVREEIKMLEVAGNIQSSIVKLNQASKLPTVAAFVDLGAQAVNFEVSKKAPYYMVGLTVSVPIYNGSRNDIQIKTSQIDCEKNDLMLSQTEQAFQLEHSMAENALNVAKQTLLSETSALKSAESYYNLIDKGYKEGIHSLIEYIDARSQLTEALMRKNIAVFNVLKAQANLERQNASFTF